MATYLGEVLAGETAEADFPYANSGTGPLTIAKITTSCGCLVAQPSPRLRPGETGILRAKLATSPLQDGPVAQTVELLSDDPTEPVVRLLVSALVHPLFRITPPNPLTIAVSRGLAIHVLFTLTPAGPFGARVTSVSPGGPGVEARLLPTAQSRGPGGARVEVAVRPLGNEGDSVRSVVVSTNSPRVPRITLIVHAVAGERIIVSPPFLHLGTLGPKAGPGPARLVSVYHWRSPLRVLDARPDTAALGAVIRRSPWGRGAEIAVCYQGGWTPGPKTGVIVVTTDDPASPRIELRYQALVLGGEGGVGGER